MGGTSWHVQMQRMIRSQIEFPLLCGSGALCSGSQLWAVGGFLGWRTEQAASILGVGAWEQRVLKGVE